MSENDDLRSLIKDGFKELGTQMKEQGEILSELKDDMKIIIFKRLFHEIITDRETNRSIIPYHNVHIHVIIYYKSLDSKVWWCAHIILHYMLIFG